MGETKSALSAEGVYTERKFVTAEMARTLLRSNIVHNRPVQEGRIKEFIQDMKAGRWKENGSTIVIAKAGELIDGQHRLHACMECGVGFWTLVAYNVDRDAFLTIDRGQTRSTGQQLHLATGLTDYNAVSSALTYLYRFRDGIMMATGRPTSLEADEMLQMNPGIPGSVAYARHLVHRFKAGSIPIVAVCHYLFTRQDATLAEAYFDALATGASLREIDPVYQLRFRIISAHGNPSKTIGSYELLALLFKTWIAEREQRTMKLLKWHASEPFPNIGPIESIHKIKRVIDESKSHPGRKKRRAGVMPDVPASKIPAQPKLTPAKQPESKLDQLIAKHQGLDKRS
jgi:hypothetical protein